MNARNPRHDPKDHEPPTPSELALVLASIADLMRSQREMLESIRRIEHDLQDAMTRLDAATRPAAAELANELPSPPKESTAADPASDESLLRAIESALRQGNAIDGD